MQRTPEATFIVRMKGADLSHDVVYANDAFFELTGYSASEVPKILGEESDKDAILDAVQAILHGQSTEGKTILYRRDGGTFDAHWRAHPTPAPGNRD